MRNYFVSVFVCAALTVIAAGTAAGQQPNPPGSYLQSCNAIKTSGATLTATCAPKEKSGLLSGQAFIGQSKIDNFFECHGDISNNNGTLTCTRNPQSLTMKKTVAAVINGMRMVLGTDPANSAETHQWIGRMFAAGWQPDFFKNHGFTNNETIVFFRSYLANEPLMRSTVIRRAFADVYSLPPSSKDAGFWDGELRSKTNGYSQIVSTEQQKMNSARPVRRLMIIAAYQKAMGRPANAGDLTYWEGRPEIFKELVEAARSYMYSPNGSKDLDETIRRAWQARTGNTPSLQEFESAKKKAVAGRLIYSEM